MNFAAALNVPGSRFPTQRFREERRLAHTLSSALGGPEQNTPPAILGRIITYRTVCQHLEAFSKPCVCGDLRQRQKADGGRKHITKETVLHITKSQCANHVSTSNGNLPRPFPSGLYCPHPRLPCRCTHVAWSPVSYTTNFQGHRYNSCQGIAIAVVELVMTLLFCSQ